MQGQDAVTSKAWIGVFIAVVGPYAARYGIDDAQLALIAGGISTVIGVVLNLWGRQTATGPVTHVLGVPMPQALIPATSNQVTVSVDGVAPTTDVAATIDPSQEAPK
jgi:hypothetical protein